MTLPGELQEAIISHLFLPDLQHFADSRLMLSQACKARLRRHRKLEQFAKFSFEDAFTEKWPKLPYWKTLLIQCLREPETIYYVTSLHGPDTSWSKDPVPFRTLYVQEEPFISSSDRVLVETAIAQSPWIADDDDYSHLFEDKSTPGFNSQLVPQWKTIDLLSILLPMLYNLEYLCLSWDLDEAAYENRKDYISLVQVLERIHDATKKDAGANPWPKLRLLTMGMAPPQLTALIDDVIPGGCYYHCT